MNFLYNSHMNTTSSLISQRAKRALPISRATWMRQAPAYFWRWFVVRPLCEILTVTFLWLVKLLLNPKMIGITLRLIKLPEPYKAFPVVRWRDGDWGTRPVTLHEKMALDEGTRRLLEWESRS